MLDRCSTAVFASARCVLVAVLLGLASTPFVAVYGGTDALVRRDMRPGLGPSADFGEGSGGPPGGPRSLGAATPEPVAWLTDGAPNELAVTHLGSMLLEENVPEFPARMTLARQHFAPRTWSGVWQALGPVLFVVEEGSVMLSREGQLTRLEPGASALMQRDQFYGVINDSDAPATLLRLSIAPPSAPELPVGVAPAQIVTVIRVPDPLPPRKAPTRTWLFQSVVPWRPMGPLRLFVAHAAWDPAQGGSIRLRHPGWVGLVLVEGSLRVDETATLRAGGCRLMPPRAAYRTAAGDDPPAALLFGILPEGHGLWLPDEGAPNASPATIDAPDIACGAGS